MLDTPCTEVVRRVLATHCIYQFPFHFPSCTSPHAITFQLYSNKYVFGDAGASLFWWDIRVNWPWHSCRWPTWRTVSSIICLFESSTCFEQLCAHPQEEKCIKTTSDIITVLHSPCFVVVWRVLATHCIRQFPLHFPSCTSLCPNTFQLDSNPSYLSPPVLEYTLGV